MTYEIHVTEELEDLLDDWDNSKSEELKKKLKKLKTHPEKRGDPLWEDYKGNREIRFRNSYRAIYEVKDGKVIVKEVKHKDDF